MRGNSRWGAGVLGVVEENSGKKKGSESEDSGRTVLGIDKVGWSGGARSHEAKPFPGYGVVGW